MGWLTVMVVIAVIVVLLAPLILLYARRRWLSSQGGLFDCAHRIKEGQDAEGWALGFGRYRDDRLDWYRAFSLSLRPSRSFQRATTVWLQRRAPSGVEQVALFDGSWVVRLGDRVTGHEHNLAMDLENVMALMAWLESAPPGSHYVPGSGDSPL
ncbi:DUF2550 domain-containing protein [Arachnia propionica]|uniref:DUF2550 family protein n=1 Tax=Arachnia propionica TaxID=1750 RepID=A0A3P1WXB7_9ACTN|nr:DUF2550 domain-containing protein [Arachnia propionica]RRD50568.1 DUF2550 family protein [Arachnia propionica]